MKTTFRTSDFSLATTLTTLGYQIKEMDRTKDPKRVEFIFEKDEDLDDFVEKFWANALQIEPKSFCMQQKAIKSQLYHFI